MTTITGTAGADSLTGTSGNDIIDGGVGADTMAGGLGHDTYYVDNVGDVIIENPGEGTDSVISSVNYVLPDNVENLKITGAANIAIGNNWDNTLTGNSGNDTLDGGGGADLMIGGKGNDLFYVNVFSDNGVNNKVGTTDVIVDNGGHDTVACGAFPSGTFTYTMQNGLDDVDFSLAASNFTVTGNAVANAISAGSGNNSLSGMNGNDTLVAGDGNDTLSGGLGKDVLTAGNGNDTLSGGTGNDVLTAGSGNDTLDGGTGADTMTGGAGNDTFYVDNIHDVINVPAPGGAPYHDLIMSTIAINLAPLVGSPAYTNIENVTLTGKGSVSITGDAQDNTLTGNTGNNVIHGGAGNDTIDGGGGHDTLYGDLGADTFSFSSTKEFATIKDFSIAQGDKIDITNVLTGYAPGIAISDFVHIYDSGPNSAMYVNPTGDGNSAHFIRMATIDGINGLTGEEALLLDTFLVA